MGRNDWMSWSRSSSRRWCMWSIWLCSARTREKKAKPTTASCTFLLIEYRNTIKIEREYKGVIIYKDGGVFQGHFSDDSINGRGRRVFASLDVYEGDYEEDEMKGAGCYLYANGERFEGEWKDSQREGKGRLTVPGEGVWEGTWVNDKKHGMFRLMREGECVKQVEWNNGVAKK
eukprot:TRINITY_DN2933_c0_g1_i2.p1 TRINITY_DN2933_c0_g1~~TRINITY_DN2933_c0_g1_i2.p1  ORF type:complete len:174 (-),score=41.66 TRINITY_DN2933_c0_g1_i2:152-673(-)